MTRRTADDRVVERKAAETLLGKSRTITIGERSFKVAPPTLATLCEFSRLCPVIPYVDELSTRRTEQALAAAVECDTIVDQIAILIMGEAAPGLPLSKCWRRCYDMHELKDYLKYGCTPSQLNRARQELLSMMDLQDFFELSTFLQEVSLIRSTREVEKETTAYGR